MSLKSYLWLVIAVAVHCQEKLEDWPGSYNVAPYKHVYPPTSLNQAQCHPDYELNKTCPLFILLIKSFGGSLTSSGVVPAIQVALDQINVRTDLLPGYTLHYALLDSQCDHTTALDALHAGLLHPPTKLAVVGAGCSVATEPTAEVSHYYNLMQVSCCSASTELMNRRRFRKHFQVYPADITLAYGYFGIIHDSRWRKVSIIVEDEFVFTTTMNELKRLLSASNISFSETKYEPDVNPFLTDPDDRVYVLSMYPPYARQILCKAYSINVNFKYPRNLFLINGWYPNNWWEGTEEERMKLKKMYNCDSEQRKSLIPYTLSILTSGLAPDNSSSISDNLYTAGEIDELYKTYLEASRLNVSKVVISSLCYDAIWVLAMALNKTMTDININHSLQKELNKFVDFSNNTSFGLQNFNYKNSMFADIFYNYLSETNYQGIVGSISFDENGSRRIDAIDISQYHYKGGIIESNLVAKVLWQNISNFKVIYLKNTSTIWPEGIPYDGIVVEKIATVHVAVTTIFTLLALFGILLAVIFILWNFTYRNKRLIRLTSPYLNVLIGLGAVILYLNIFVHVIPSSNIILEKWLCNIDPWLISIGYSLCYGTILAKIGRVYYIFSNPTAVKKTLHDWKLVLFVLLLVVIDITILSTFTIMEYLHKQLNPHRVQSQEKFEETIGIYEKNFQNFIFICDTESRLITLGVLYGYKAVLQVIALVLAISIRKIKIKGLNDAKYILSAVYVTSIITSIVIISTYTVMKLVNVYAVLFSFCLFIGTTVILLLVFVPPMAGLLKDPEGSSIFRNKSGEKNDSSGNKYLKNSMPVFHRREKDMKE